jgi:hypothetical protein
VQRTATAKAEARARFDLDCPDVKGEVINREQLEPLAFRGPVLARHAIGVAGCGRRAIVDVLCSENGHQYVECGEAGCKAPLTARPSSERAAR